MTFLLSSLRKDLRRRLADPVAFAIWLGIPLLIGLLMSMIASGGGPPTARLLVVDQDDSVLTDLLLGAAGSEQMGEFVQVEEVALPEGRERIDAGDATALLILPEGLGEAVLNEEPATLTLITNPAQRILPAILVEGLEILVEATFYVQRLFGEPLRRIVGMASGVADAGSAENDETEPAPVPGESELEHDLSTSVPGENDVEHDLSSPVPGEGDLEHGLASAVPSDADVAAVSVEINRTMQRIQELAFPPVLTVVGEDEAEPAAGDESSAAESSPSQFDIGRLFLPGILFMSLVFIAQGLSSDLWEERDRGTLRRVLGTRGHVVPWFAGKVASGAVVIGVVSLIAGIMAAGLYDAPLGRLPLALLWCTYAGTAMLCYFLLLQTLTSSQRGGNLMTTLVVFPLIMIGGSFFPFEAMPSWMAAIGGWTPNGLALLHLKAMLWGRPEPVAVAGAAVGLGLPALGAALLCLWRVRGGFAR